jgi:hypothetical protein
MFFWVKSPCKLKSSRWRQHASPKSWLLPNSPHGDLPQKNIIGTSFSFTTFSTNYAGASCDYVTCINLSLVHVAVVNCLGLDGRRWLRRAAMSSVQDTATLLLQILHTAFPCFILGQSLRTFLLFLLYRGRKVRSALTIPRVQLVVNSLH